MPVTTKWFGKGMSHMANGTVDFDTDTIKVMLTTSAYTPDQDTHDFRDDVTNEISGTGYTAGGAAISSRTRSYDAASNEVRLGGADVSWSSASFTARYAVLYKARGGASSADELLAWVDFAADQSVSSGTFTLQWASDGILKITVS
jgi:hypothetical protein